MHIDASRFNERCRCHGKGIAEVVDAIAAHRRALELIPDDPGVLGNLEAGLQLYKERGLEVKAEYMLSAGDNYLGQGANLRGAWHF